MNEAFRLSGPPSETRPENQNPVSENATREAVNKERLIALVRLVRFNTNALVLSVKEVST